MSHAMHHCNVFELAIVTKHILQKNKSKDLSSDIIHHSITTVCACKTHSLQFT